MEAIILCISKASDRLGLSYRYIDKNKNFIIIENELYFQLNRTPFNVESMARLCKDKEHQYECLQSKVNLPKTIGFLDYNTDEKYKKYLSHDSADKIIDAIETEFGYPVVLKPNHGALGMNVFFCKHREHAAKALEMIFNKEIQGYDYVAIAQQFIKPKQEFRVICFDGQPVLCYERVFGQAEFGAKYWETEQGKALALDTDGLAARAAKEFAPALNLPGLRYVGLDIILDENDQLFLIELNSGPQVNHFIENNGDEPIIDMYETVLKQYFEKKM